MTLTSGDNVVSTASSNADDGRKLYHAIWQLVQDNFYNRERLVQLDWPSLKHRYDRRIVDEASALGHARRILALLNDSYTRLMDTEEVEVKATKREADDVFIYSHRLRENIGYLGIDDFAHTDTAEKIEAHLREISDCDAFVIDVRDNGGGMLCEATAALGLFINDAFTGYIQWQYSTGALRRAMHMRPEHSIAHIEEDGKQPRQELFERMQALIAGKPMVVLINGATASAAEYFAAALTASVKDGSIVSMGTKSYGKGIGQVDYPVLDKVTVKISCMRFMSPTGVWFGDAAQTVNNGIEPDFVSNCSYNTVDAVTEGANYL
ncbi:MAG TPA: S41 family peptidase [Drouetiella sp.]